MNQYHAHLYFDYNSTDQVKKIENVISKVRSNFSLRIGTIHLKPVGPHPIGSCLVYFSQNEYDEFTTWLEDNRDGLDILIHPMTGDDLYDHTDGARWIGNKIELNLSIF